MNRKLVLASWVLLAIACAAPPETAEDAGLDSGPGEIDAGGGGDAGSDASASFDAFVTDAPPDAPAADAGEPCSTDGMYRSRSCGCGGAVSEQCSGGFWQARSGCEGALGDCFPGMYETSENPALCEVYQRVCTDTCIWGNWGRVTPAAECMLDERRCPSDVEPEGCLCDAECQCQPNPDCP